MARFATYDVVTDNITTLSVNATGQTEFTLDFDSRVDFGVRSVISYMIKPGQSGVVYKLSVSNLLSNGTLEFKEIESTTLASTAFRFVRQEVISANTFKKVNVSGLGVHTLKVQVTSGGADFSDIVHMYSISD